MSKISLLYTWLIRSFFYFFPDIPLFMRFRGFCYSLFIRNCGYNFQVAHNANLKGLTNMIIGNNVFIANNTTILISGELIIEDDVMIGVGSVLVSSNHSLLNNSFRYGERISGLIILKKGSWVASNCTVLSGAVLPMSSVLAAGSVLNKEYLIPFSLYAGSPSKFIKTIC